MQGRVMLILGDSMKRRCLTQEPESIDPQLQTSAERPVHPPKAAKEFFPAVPKTEAVAVAGWQEMYDVKDGMHSGFAFSMNAQVMNVYQDLTCLSSRKLVGPAWNEEEDHICPASRGC